MNETGPMEQNRLSSADDFELFMDSQIVGASLLATYQVAATKTALKVEGGLELYERVLGLGEEVAELHHKASVNKLVALIGRWHPDISNSELALLREQLHTASAALLKEAGDVLWYCAAICSELGLELEQAPRAALRHHHPGGWNAGYVSAFANTYPIEHQFTFSDIEQIAEAVVQRDWSGMINRLPHMPFSPEDLAGVQEPLDQLIASSGEVLGLTKKALRDRSGQMDRARAERILGAIGMCLISLQRICSKRLDLQQRAHRRMDFPQIPDADRPVLASVATFNLYKLAQRAARNKLHGEGDNR